MQQLIFDTAGRCYMAGRFQTVNQQPRDGLARLLPNGVLDDSFRPPPGIVEPYGPVHLAVQTDGRILCLTEAGGDTYRFLRLNTDGSLDNSFRPTVKARRVWSTGNNQALVNISDSGWPVLTERLLARLSSDGSLDSKFHRAEFASSSDSYPSIVDVIQQPDGKLVVAGSFISMDGMPRTNLVRLDVDGAVDVGFSSPFGTQLDGVETEIRSIAMDSKGR